MVKCAIKVKVADMGEPQTIKCGWEMLEKDLKYVDLNGIIIIERIDKLPKEEGKAWREPLRRLPGLDVAVGNKSDTLRERAAKMF
jgi:hypothetical protein